MSGGSQDSCDFSAKRKTTNLQNGTLCCFLVFAGCQPKAQILSQRILQRVPVNGLWINPDQHSIRSKIVWV
jgi:hypothetical protein